MADIICDYSRCSGNGDCATVCPVGIMEGGSEGERWCRPILESIVNKEALESYHSIVEPKIGALFLKIHYNVPDCIECMACVDACREGAIEIRREYEGSAVEYL